jgi:hypothetical protein
MTEVQVSYTAGEHLIARSIVPTECRDRVLLLVERRSQASDEEVMPCMQIVGLEQGGGIGYCNTLTDETCIICDRSVCEEHWSEQRIYVYVHEDEQKNLFRLCQGCASLSREDAHALRTLRLQMNG